MGFLRMVGAGGLAGLGGILASGKLSHFAPVLGEEFTYTADEFSGPVGSTIEGSSCRSVRITAHDGLQLHATLFDVDDPRGVLYIVHGILEHKERYYPLMEFLQQRGWASIVADVRGHGASIDATYTHGYMDGPDELLDDMARVREVAAREYYGYPIAMLGHSFGSILARLYLADSDADIDKLILTGPPMYKKAAEVGQYLGHIIEFVAGGKRGHSSVMSFANPDKSWLSYDEDNLRSVETDPLMIPDLCNRGGYTLWTCVRLLKDTEHFRCANPDLPILCLAGEDDAYSGGEAGLIDSMETLTTIGYRNVDAVNYPDMKHEVLNETDRASVWADILAFLDDDIVPESAF